MFTVKQCNIVLDFGVEALSKCFGMYKKFNCKAKSI